MLGLTLLLALVLRVIGLDAPLWYDEILTLTDSVRLPLAEIAAKASFNNHPFFSLQAKLATLLFGESNWALRLPAVIFGVASIAATWALAYQVADAKRAHVTALLVTLAYHHVWYSQNARAYTELMFWLTVSTSLLIRGIRKPSTKIWLIYGLSAAIGLYTHLTAAAYLAAHASIAFVYLFRTSPMPKRNADASPLTLSMLLGAFVVGTVLTLIAYAPVVAGLFDEVAEIAAKSSVDVMVEYQSPFWTLMEMIRSVARPSVFSLAVAFLVVLLVTLGLAESFEREPILGWVLLLHIPLVLVVLLGLSARIWPRFFFADMGFVLFFLTQGVFASCRFIEIAAQRIGVARVGAHHAFAVSALLMCLISASLLPRNYRIPKQDFDGAHALIEAEKSDLDRVVTLGLATVPYAPDGYIPTDWPNVENGGQLRTHRREPGRTWLVMAFPARSMRRFESVMAELDAHFEVARVFPGTLGDGSVRVYRER